MRMIKTETSVASCLLIKSRKSKRQQFVLYVLPIQILIPTLIPEENKILVHVHWQAVFSILTDSFQLFDQPFFYSLFD